MTYKLADGWKEVKLGEVALLNANNYSKSDDWKFVNYLDTGNITNNTIDHVKHINLTIDKLPSRARRKVSKDDIVYSTVRPVQKHLGIIRKPVKNMLVSTGFTVITVDKNIVDAYYLYLYLTQEPLTNHLQSIAEQRVSTYPALNVSDIENLLIWLPPLPEQKSIADTLSALDDKIEINNKINANLEAQAQAIFKHWFIDFEFPDENGNPYKSSGGEMEESELGMIPKEWEVGSLGDSILGKLISSGIDEFIGEKIYLATADVNGTNIVNNEALITRKDKPSRANMQPKSNTIWFAKMKDSRKLIFVHKRDEILKEKYIFSTGFAGIQGTEDSIYYLWTYIQSEIFDSIKNNLCSGTTMQAINNTNINKIKVKIPENYILEKFNTIVEPFYIKIINNRNENQKLSQLRDTLLPKLMSGKIRTLLDDIGGD
jgi:type I restriction enzyme S subunit